MKKLLENYYFNSQKTHIAYEISVQLTELILKSDKSLRDIVVLCIGTDRSTGDSLGPIVGYKLLNHPKNNLTVYGTLDNPVHALNLCETLEMIKRNHSNPYIIAIDASLGAAEHVGYITIGTGPVKPGLGVNKSLPDVGDIHITGIVNISGCMDPMLLQTTRLKTVMKLADIISTSLIYSLIPSYSAPKRLWWKSLRTSNQV